MTMHVNGWKRKDDAFEFVWDGTRVVSIPRINRELIPLLTPIQLGTMFTDTCERIEDFIDHKIANGTPVPREQKRLMALQTYAMMHAVNDDPEATIPLSRV
jgi:hypothetical protein